MKTYAVMLFLHVIAVAVWVGGMFLMHFAVRPACVAQLDPPSRLPLLTEILKRFFRWVAIAAVTVLLTGLVIILIGGGFGVAHPSVHLMSGVGVVMIAIFAHIRLVPFRRLQAAVAARDWPVGARSLDQIRKEVAFNLVLGVATIAIATLGRVIL
jgi:uncharacterized membrane protein